MLMAALTLCLSHMASAEDPLRFGDINLKAGIGICIFHIFERFCRFLRMSAVLRPIRDFEHLVVSVRLFTDSRSDKFSNVLDFQEQRRYLCGNMKIVGS